MEFQKSLALKTCPPPSIIARHVFAPLQTCALKSCPPPRRPYILWCVKTYDHPSINISVKIYYKNGKSLGNILVLFEEISAAPAAAKIVAIVFSRSEMALICLCTQILPPPPLKLCIEILPPPPTACTKICVSELKPEVLESVKVW